MYKLLLSVLLTIVVGSTYAQYSNFSKSNKPIIILSKDAAREIKYKRATQTMIINGLIIVAADIAMRKGDRETWRKIAIGGSGVFFISFVYTINPDKFHIGKRYKLYKY